ncbi:syntaxin-binding protein 2-like [Artemia franciscana]|uniref:syntaxin-binding protein 2-like n=1 Tax=Artemia franciscana TaxID=6661 RepID=UPI0032DA5467
MNEVLRSNKIGTNWRSLVVDRLSLRMVSSCFTMYEINTEKIATIEDLLDRSREPHPSLEAVYLLSPTNDSVESLISDITYPWRKKYKAAHVYFTRVCPDELFNKIVEVVKCLKLSNFLETLKEINIDCIPYESQVSY